MEATVHFFKLFSLIFPLHVFIMFILFAIKYYEISLCGISRVVRKRSKKGIYPTHLHDMWRLSFWESEFDKEKSIGLILDDMEGCIRKVTENNEDAFRYALLAFEDKEFVDALSKYKIIRKNQALLDAFLANESDPERDRHSYQLQQQQIIAPLKKGVSNFQNRYEKFERLEDKSKSNELNLLLQQDFNQIHDMNPMKELTDTYKVYKVETLEMT